MPRHFRAIGEWYDDFSQVSDEQVRDLLARSLRADAEGVRSPAVPFVRTRNNET
jgi:predicted phosphoribosyltransferase